MVGNTPVLWITEPLAPAGRGFWAKLEGANPGGMKDRTALHMVERATARGELAPGAQIIESTSGTLGLGLALAGMVHGHPVTLVTDPGLEPLMRHMLAAYGARVELVDEPHPVGGWQQARRDRVAQLLAEDPAAWCPDQYRNPDNREAYRSLALELVAQLGRIDVLVCSVGTGGHSAGVARVLREYFRELRLVGVDTVASTIFGHPAGPRLMRVYLALPMQATRVVGAEAAATLMTAAVLGVGAAAVFPFEMDTVVALCGDRLVATHYGLYNTIVGVGILLGNLGTGTILDAARAAGVSSLAWAGLIAIGAVSAGGLALLARAGRLDAPVPVG
ncbi:PLP-dependent cysteine synthase family protein [Nocardia cyriacigeorgica]|uniref:PLP-dependent cysteine synthase family protein n=1 Tax=Nocardia cyriacigeorgica TaxID=135487 RepID=UPI0020171C70|nr:pyridoxal-phosphate dependent enzyme [Nocardia cyriacigeorgica]